MHTLARHRRATQADMDGSHCEVWAVGDASASLCQLVRLPAGRSGHPLARQDMTVWAAHVTHVASAWGSLDRFCLSVLTYWSGTSFGPVGSAREDSVVNSTRIESAVLRVLR